MQATRAEKNAEIDRNLEAFLVHLPSLPSSEVGKCALMRNGEIVELFSSALEAQMAGNRRFPDNLFSIQEVRAAAEELGYLTYALPPR